MAGDNVSHVMFVGVGDFDLIVLAAVSDAVGEGVRLVAGTVPLLVFFDCRVCGRYMGWLGVAFNEDFHHDSSEAKLSAVRWVNVLDISMQTRSILESIS